MASRKFFIKVRAEGISWQIKATKTSEMDLLEVMQSINDIFDKEVKSKAKKK